MYRKELNMDVSMLNISKMFSPVHPSSQFKSWFWIQKQVNREARSDRENYWIETLQTSYHYDLSEMKRKSDPNLPARCLLFPIPMSRQRSTRCRNNVNFDCPQDMDSIFNCIHNYITDDIKKCILSCANTFELQ